MHDSAIDGQTPLILRSVVTLAHELGKEVVAEGVENQADASYLRSIGCEFGQGFYYGEPMSARDVGALLNALANHRRRKERERAQAERAPSSLDVEVQNPADIPSLPGPSTAQA